MKVEVEAIQREQFIPLQARVRWNDEDRAEISATALAFSHANPQQGLLFTEGRKALPFVFRRFLDQRLTIACLEGFRMSLLLDTA